MTTITNVRTQPSGVLKWEANLEYCREEYEVPAGTTFKSGTVVKAGAAAGQIAAHDPGAAGDPIGVVLFDVEAPAGETATAVVVVRDAIVGRRGLVWKDGATAAQVTAGEAKLLALGIVVREDV